MAAHPPADWRFSFGGSQCMYKLLNVQSANCRCSPLANTRAERFTSHGTSEYKDDPCRRRHVPPPNLEGRRIWTSGRAPTRELAGKNLQNWFLFFTEINDEGEVALPASRQNQCQPVV